jgi:hypothetical protein
MIEPFKGEFELFDVKSRRNVTDKKLRLILECPREIEKDEELTAYKFKNVKVNIILKGSESTKKIEGTFEVYNVDTRRLKNGNKIRLVLEQMYDKDQDLICTEFKFYDVILSMEALPDDMFEDIEDPEVE